MFEIIPAIDLRDGKCVRLTQGDYGRQTVFGDNPPAVARRWAELGAPRIHVVDLDGAAAGHPTQLGVIEQIARSVSVPVQLGGGIRTTETVQAAFDAGVSAVILGTAAVEDPAFADWCLRAHPDRCIIGIDARDGRVAVRGWLERTDVLATDLAQDFSRRGARTIVYTDISRDGMLDGPNLDGIREMVERTGLRVVASGGVSTVAQIVAVRDAGASGAIIGKALYVGSIDLTEALEAVAESRRETHAQ